MNISRAALIFFGISLAATSMLHAGEPSASQVKEAVLADYKMDMMATGPNLIQEFKVTGTKKLQNGNYVASIRLKYIRPGLDYGYQAACPERKCYKDYEVLVEADYLFYLNSWEKWAVAQKNVIRSEELGYKWRPISKSMQEFYASLASTESKVKIPSYIKLEANAGRKFSDEEMRVLVEIATAIREKNPKLLAKYSDNPDGVLMLWSTCCEDPTFRATPNANSKDTTLYLQDGGDGMFYCFIKKVGARRQVDCGFNDGN